MPFQCAMDLNYIVLYSACSSALLGVHFFIAFIPFSHEKSTLFDERSPLESEYYAHRLPRPASQTTKNIGLEVCARDSDIFSRQNMARQSISFSNVLCEPPACNLGVPDRTTTFFSQSTVESKRHMVLDPVRALTGLN